ARLRAWLERHKEYPHRARVRRQQGTALLHFVVDANGRVLSHRIDRTSGYDLLDEAVEDMIARAQPLPPPPPDMGRRLEITVPVQFVLR
ncbi:MAG: energy transducer TonB, partial [Alphaproteobacteria bacterium]